jgi:hypothetical protein
MILLESAVLSALMGVAAPAPLGDTPEPVPVVAAAASVTASAPCDCVTVAPLTVVSIEIQTDLGSKTSTTGELFPLRLAAPMIVGGKEVLAAGTPGQGEVVHAKKSGGMGAAGELVLAARFLDIGGRHLRLRSLRIAPSGQSKINTVNTVNAASAASPLPIGLIGFFISGGQATVPAGTIAEAKTAESFTIEMHPPENSVQPTAITKGE